jgi:Fe-S oxidoreductase
VKEYGHLLRDDPAYAEKAARVSALTRDLSEVLAREDLSSLKPAKPRASPSTRRAACNMARNCAASSKAS